MNRMLVRLFVLLTLVGAGPTIASAQSLAGSVRDTSGAVLPGVTVEASSPALIAKVRSSVTDDTGQYRITDLPPGSYKVTFTLPGFATVVREGVELTGGGVMTIGAEIDPGVPVLVSERGRPMRPIRLALKSGNFGSPDFFAKALDRIAGHE